ncbi:MAG: aspartate aminotransferase family protein [Kiloniellales bacterium]|nr:aspartate aminotransferase family protein [Kiloniellales bacterium]
MDYRFPKGHVFYRKLTAALPQIVRGEGVYLYDEAGKQYLDGSGGALVVNVGHGVQEIAEAMAAQARKVAYVNGKHFTNEPVEALARELGAVMPAALNKVYFLSSGSAATEAAIKLARQYWVEAGHPGKYKIIARRPGYHGNTLAALSASGRPLARHFYAPLLHDFTFIPAPTRYRCPDGETYAAYGIRCAQALEAAIAREGAETVAAFIAEPIMGTGGVLVPPAGYFPAIRAVLDRHDILMIADEVICGFGRTGDKFGSDSFDIRPDIITMAKGLSSGYLPISASAIGEKVWQVLEDTAPKMASFGHGFTYSAHPTCAAAALANLEIIEREDLVGNAARAGERLRTRLGEELFDHPLVGDIRGRGLMIGVELVADKKTKAVIDPTHKFGLRVMKRGYEEGVIVRALPHGNVIAMSPPLIFTDDNIEELVAGLKRAILAVHEECRRDGIDLSRP